MTAITFDSLGYFEQLKNAGFTEEQAKVQASVMRQQAELQSAALRETLEKYDEASRRELATKGDLADAKHEILKWMIAVIVAQTALLVAVIAFLK